MFTLTLPSVIISTVVCVGGVGGMEGGWGGRGDCKGMYEACICVFVGLYEGCACVCVCVFVCE
jgi:hypothetical protein